MRYALWVATALFLTARGKEHVGTAGDFDSLLSGSPQAQPYRVEGEPFTGLLVNNWTDDQRRYEIELKEGRPAGRVQRWDKQGVLRFEGKADADSGRPLWVKTYCANATLETEEQIDGSQVYRQQWDCGTGHRIAERKTSSGIPVGLVRN